MHTLTESLDERSRVSTVSQTSAWRTTHALYPRRPRRPSPLTQSVWRLHVVMTPARAETRSERAEGSYGEWLWSHPVVAYERRTGTLFTHGGLTATFLLHLLRSYGAHVKVHEDGTGYDRGTFKLPNRSTNEVTTL